MLTKNQTQQIVAVAAPAKINLCFDIVARREDGYHEINTLFQAIELHDLIRFKFSPRQSNLEITPTAENSPITLNKSDSCIEPAHFPIDENNSISQTIKLFLAQLPNRPAVSIQVQIEKNIPIGAGLAGGSSDAAATLIALNHYFDSPLSESKLIQLAAQIGSDVAFCLSGGLAVGRGRGEQLEKVDLNLDYHLILVKPRSIHISTPWAYNMYDQFIESGSSANTLPSHSVSDALLALKFQPQLDKQTHVFANAFEPIIFKEYPLLAEIKNNLLNLGCLAAHLTGSGPTIYGLVRSEQDGQRILKSIHGISIEDSSDIAETKEDKALILDAWLTKCIGHGARILASKVA